MESLKLCNPYIYKSLSSHAPVFLAIYREVHTVAKISSFSIRYRYRKFSINDLHNEKDFLCIWSSVRVIFFVYKSMIFLCNYWWDWMRVKGDERATFRAMVIFSAFEYTISLILSACVCVCVCVCVSVCMIDRRNSLDLSMFSWATTHILTKTDKYTHAHFSTENCSLRSIKLSVIVFFLFFFSNFLLILNGLYDFFAA